jgi:phosphopantothenoylcysteine decarboxylase / phosphopantothenate---cysteine ligase
MIKDSSIVLGITGSIAAYKAAILASKLTQAGARVDTVMTDSAQKFITPLSLRSITGRPVSVSMWEMSCEVNIEHISLAERADAVLIAPATANFIAKLAAGIADDLLSCVVLATRSPVIIAPAMNVNMYENAVTQENISRLKSRGFVFIGVANGRLACGAVGSGRLAEIEDIIGTVRMVLGRSGDLAGKKVVVTAGGTREALDPVRFVGNRGSGRMGYAIAEAARDRGASVVLISTASLSEPAGVEMVYVDTAGQMKEAVDKAVAGADVLVMAAAVADFQARETSPEKIKKSTGRLSLEMVPTADILGSVKGNFTRVGFAAESCDIITNAEKKLKNKSLDLIMANDITQPGWGFAAETNKVTLIDRFGLIEELPLMSKRKVAERLWDWVVSHPGDKQP